jgi:hypothetical protein
MRDDPAMSRPSISSGVKSCDPLYQLDGRENIISIYAGLHRMIGSRTSADARENRFSRRLEISDAYLGLACAGSTYTLHTLLAAVVASCDELLYVILGNLHTRRGHDTHSETGSLRISYVYVAHR